MLIVWPKPYTINDLRSPQVGVGMTQLDRRKAVRIGVIDDEPFAPEDTPRQLGFDITYLGNIQTLAQIPRFRIILCDLKGVFPTSAKQGGALIKYVRDSHPTIYVLAYSGAHPSSALFRSAFDEADATIQKMADIDLWIDLLDEFVNKCVDPVEFWQRLRLYLISRNIEALQLMYLEDAFAKAVLKHDAAIFSDGASHLELPETIKSLVEGIAVNVISQGLISIW
jgi:hypothetical protein